MSLKSKGWIDKNIDMGLHKIFEQRNIIASELKTILHKNIWPIFNNYRYSINDFIKSNNYKHAKQSKINTENDNGDWRMFYILGKCNKGLKITKKCSNELKNTIQIINNSSSKIKGAVFSLFEPGYKVELHNDINDYNDQLYYRVHIPLIIPNNNNLYEKTIIDTDDLNEPLAVFQLEYDYRLLKNDEWFIWNPNYMHSAWNNTNELRVVLIIDIFA